jgi:hypothetical protein
MYRYSIHLVFIYKRKVSHTIENVKTHYLVKIDMNFSVITPRFDYLQLVIQYSGAFDNSNEHQE